MTRTVYLLLAAVAITNQIYLVQSALDETQPPGNTTTLASINITSITNVTTTTTTTAAPTTISSTPTSTSLSPSSSATPEASTSTTQSQTPSTTPSPSPTQTINSTTSSTNTTQPPLTITTQINITTDNQLTPEIKETQSVKKTTVNTQLIDMPNTPEKRIIVNKPTSSPQSADFAPESIETRVSEATTKFGLSFLNKLSNDTTSNVILSPLSIQNLLNMILLGSGDGSPTQVELAKVLNYGSTNLFTPPTNDTKSRLKPHRAMHNVFQSILDITHVSVPPLAPVRELDLLNTNSGSIEPALKEEIVIKQQKTKSVAAHLQTSVREADESLSGQVNFTLANLVLVDKDQADIKAEYEKELKEYYNVNVEQFSQKPKGNKTNNELPLPDRINNWVKKMTQNQIEKLVDDGDLDDVVMVLLNAAHFKGRWLHTFNPKATIKQYFYNNGKDDDVTEVNYMRQKDVFGYADFSAVSLQNEMNSMPDSSVLSSEDAETLLTEDKLSKVAANESSSSKLSNTTSSLPVIELSREETRRMDLTAKLNCTVLMLPFSLNDGQELSMVILLPSKRDGVAELQAALDGAILNEIYKSLSEQQVQVELPKFSFESSHDAKDVLLKMGLSTIFSHKANLERMVKSKTGHELGVQVDKVIHKAKINVDEMGAEAAAASMANIVLRNFIRPPTPIFFANHPFLFVIRHNRSNMPIFMGRVSKF